jgi:ABC-type antimicrobial peptide transport system permease subunit
MVVVDGDPNTIVGVLAAGFAFPDRRARFWTPYIVQRVSADPAQSRRTSGLSAIARLAPGATAAQVEAEGTAAARSVPITMSTQLLFGKGGPPIVHARPLIADMTGDVKPALVLLAAAVACVLLIACANIANLFLSRGIARQRELAVRAAIGAGRGRLARQLLIESFVLSAGGGLLGLALAGSLLRLAVILAPARFPRLDDVQIDASVMAFAAVASVVTALVSGLVPALRGARFDLAASLHGGDGATAGGFRGLRARRMRDGLLVAESAFAVMLIVGAMRTAGDPAALAALLRKTIRDVDRTVIVERVEPLADQVSTSMAQPRFATSVLITFAVVALALASVGLYGVLSYAVSQRRRELGLRAALGAGRGDLVALVLREGLLVTALGLALGLAGAAALTRVMQGLLFGVAPLDAVSFAAAPAMLVPVAIVACLLPAYRAARIDPAEALRAE